MAISKRYCIFIAKYRYDMVGRESEIELLEKNYTSDRSEFIALYGRRRVGKTYLIRTLFKERFTFQITGLANASHQEQLLNFHIAIKDQYPELANEKKASWLENFQLIKRCIEKSRQKKKVIFIDELPWFDTARSGFIQALEHFWNSWASARNDVMLIVCGSAASWMIHNLINNKGGLHNRVSQRMRINPFTLHECEELMKFRKITLDHYQLVQLYMVLGGIPFYWDKVEKGQSAAQNINNLCFAANGLLRTEFTTIFKSLFSNAERHEAIVAALAKKSKGLTRDEIIVETSLTNGGGFTRLLDELEESGFIRKYIPYGKKNRNSLYQLSDFYSFFYLKFIKNSSLNDENIWMKAIDSPQYRAWSGYAYEQVCLAHVPEIKKALGISGIETHTSSWKSINPAEGAQIDLVIDRRDGVINICEMKFSINPFSIDKKYDAELRNKIGTFKTETKTRKSVFLTMFTTFGLQQNEYAGNVQSQLDMEALFTG